MALCWEKPWSNIVVLHAHYRMNLEVQAKRRGQSERLHQHREQQGQVLRTTDLEFVCGIEVDDFRDRVKGRTVLSKHVLAVFTLGELHVHETLAAPGGIKRKSGLRKQNEHWRDPLRV